MKKRYAVVATLVLLLSGVSLHFISKARCYQLVGEAICRVDTPDKIVALSFDDGPTPEGVDAVLPILEQYDVKATFFLIGNRMEKFPDEAPKLLAAGHELGNHSYSHKKNLLRSQSFYKDEVLLTDQLLKDAGASPTLFRPPFGKRLIGLPLEVENAGYRTIMWDVEDDAEHFPDHSAYAEDILGKVRPGSIILIHPMYRHNQTARNALPLILEGLVARGYHVGTVSELLAKR